MDIKSMTKEELTALKREIDEELNGRIQTKYCELENNLIKLITDFENETGYYIAVDGDFLDRASNFIKADFYYTDKYIEPYE